MVEQRQTRGPAAAGEVDGVADGCVAVEVGDHPFVLEELRVVHEQVDPLALARDRRSRVGLRAVVGDVRHRRAAVGDAESEGAAALVRNVERGDVEALDLMTPRLHTLRTPNAPRRPSGPIGKCGGLIASDEHVGDVAGLTVGAGLIRA